MVIYINLTIRAQPIAATMENAVYLSESVVRDILIGLSRDEIIGIQDELIKSLSEVSRGGEGAYQPSASHVNRLNGQRTLFRPFTSPTNVGIKIIVTPAPMPSGKTPPLHGIVVICDQDGIPVGILGAEELTGFRTALSAMVPYMWRRRTDSILVFGAGMQALWHIRLALALRGSEIKSIAVVNRSAARAHALLAQVQKENHDRWGSPCTFHCLKSESAEYESELETRLSNADVVFCTVNSAEPLFPAHRVTHRRPANQGPLVSAVGSWQSSMMELDPAILQHAADLMHGGKPGVVLVDDREACLRNSGEIVQSRLTGEDMVEVAEALEVRDQETSRGNRPHMIEAFEEGFLAYKCIGVSVTDLSVGKAILHLAKKKEMCLTMS